MERVKKAGDRAGAFLWGQYPGPPIDYLTAFSAVYAVMVVLVARNLIHGL